MPLLECRNISKNYSKGKEKIEALADVSLNLEKGEILGIVGESGSGKSTLLKLISGLEEASGGEILFDGHILAKKRTREQYRAMQMVFQDAAGSFNPRLRVSASINDSVHNFCRKTEIEDLDALYDMLGLSSELSERYPHRLSGGQCQRFALARAVAVDPEIILCDEITSALDVSSQAQILKMFSEICKDRKMSAIFVSHDLSVISCICDRVIVMRDGKIVEEGSVRDVIDYPKEEYTVKLISSVMEVHRRYEKQRTY